MLGFGQPADLNDKSWGGGLLSWSLRRRPPRSVILVIQLTTLLEDLEGRERPDHVILAEGREPLAIDLGKLDIDVLLPQGLGGSLVFGSKSLAVPTVAVGG